MSSRTRSRTQPTASGASAAPPLTGSKVQSRRQSKVSGNQGISRPPTRVLVDTVDPLTIDTIEHRNACIRFFVHERNLGSLFRTLITALVLERPTRWLVHAGLFFLPKSSRLAQFLRPLLIYTQYTVINKQSIVKRQL